MHIHNRSVNDKVFDIWRSPGRFTKNPDMVVLPSGRYMLIYSDVDAHWSLKNQILTLLASDDEGKTWFKHREVDAADLTKGDERLVTPRLSLLNDSRLVVIIDHNDDGHFHENQTKGNWLYWSEDGGDTWTSAQKDNGIGGFEPDRILDLPDGSLGVTSHLMRAKGQEFAQVLWTSNDEGKTWTERSTIAYDGYHRFCEGAVVILDDGARLACIMRENHSGGIPCFIAYSDDNGHTWSEPQMLPFSIHRPYAKQLQDGRILVTGRHVNGGLGNYAWVGKLEDVIGTYAVGGPRRNHTAYMHDGALVIANRHDEECRYTVLPPESVFSDVDFEAEVRVEASTGKESVAFLSLSHFGQILHIAPDHIAITRGRNLNYHKVDMTQFHTIGLHHSQGWLQIKLDGQTVMHRAIFREDGNASDFHGGDPLKRSQFGQFGTSGCSYWKRISYHLDNPTLPDFDYEWTADSGEFPDQFQRDHMIQIHANHPSQQPWPDHGYSSWIQRPDGVVYLVDYTNAGDVPDTSHLVGVYIEPEDLA